MGVLLSSSFYSQIVFSHPRCSPCQDSPPGGGERCTRVRDSSPSTHVNLGHGVTDFLDLEDYLFVADHFKKQGLSLEASRVSSSQDESSLLPTVPFRGVMTSENLWRLQKLFDFPSAPPVLLRTTRKL